MASLWRWIGGALLVAGALYLLAIALSGLAIPWRPQPFDTAAATTSHPGWVNEGRYFLLNKHGFAAAGDRVVITGASTARDPFRPALIATRLPGWEVANASLSGAEIEEYRDLVDLYYADRRRGPGGRTIWVFAFSYMQFRPDGVPPGGENPTATEAMRMGLYRRENGRLVPRYPAPVERALVAALRPQAVAASLPNRAGRWLVHESGLPGMGALAARLRGDDKVRGWIDELRHRDLDRVSIPPPVRAALLEHRLADVGGDTPSPAAQYARFAALIARIRAEGDAVVLVGLPLPDWHLAAVRRSDAHHQAMLRGVLGRFADDPNVGYLSMRDLGDAENFFDSGHTEPRLWPLMSARLAEWLRAQPMLRAPRPARR